MSRKGGNPEIVKKGKETQFSETNQPTDEQKSEGWDKRRRGQDLVKFILEQGFIGAKDGELKKDIAYYFGCKESEITNEMAMLFRQAQKAISKADTPAFKAVQERAYGQPKQEIDVTSDGKPIKQNVIKLANGTELPI